MNDDWRCLARGCDGKLGTILRDRRGSVTWLQVGAVRLSQGWVDCPVCGKPRFWISPGETKRVECDCGSSVCPVCRDKVKESKGGYKVYRGYRSKTVTDDKCAHVTST